MKITRRSLNRLIIEAINKEILETKFRDDVVQQLFNIVATNPRRIFNDFLLRAQESAYESSQFDIALGKPQDDEWGDIEPARPDLPLFARVLFASVQNKPKSENLVMETLYLSVIRNEIMEKPDVSNLIFNKIIEQELESEKTHPEETRKIKALPDSRNKSKQVVRLFTKATRKLSKDYKHIVTKKAFDLVCDVLGFSSKEVIKKMLLSRLDFVNRDRQAKIAFRNSDTRAVVEEMIKSMFNVGMNQKQWRGGALQKILKLLISRHTKTDVVSGQVYSPLESFSPNRRSLFTDRTLPSTDLPAHTDIVSAISSGLLKKLNDEDMYVKAIKEDIEKFIEKIK